MWFYPNRILMGCGPFYDFAGYSFLNPEIINPKKGLAPFVLSIDDISEFYVGQTTVTRMDNLREWKERFCNRPEITDIDYLVYASSIRELDQLRSAILNNSSNIGFGLANNSFARHLNRYDCVETVDYLIYAKYCEPYVVAEEPWGNQTKDIEIMEELIDQGLQAFEETESHYIRLRYAYQIIRLAHYAERYERTLELYDYLMPKIDNDPSIVEYWIDGHRAGAMMALGQNVEASYIFSRIFDKCPSKREQAFRSFQITSEEEWRECLRYCMSDHERATLYAIRANADHSNIVEEMEAIYRFEPDNENLELLLFKELKKLEKDLLGLSFNDERDQNKQFFDIPRDNAGNIVLHLQEFVQKALEEKRVSRLDLWKIAEGYLELLAGNYYYAARTFATVRSEIENDTLKEQLKAFEMALRISSLNDVNDEIEQEVAEYTFTPTFRQHEDFPEFLRDKLSVLYAQQGYPGKSFLINHELREMKTNPSMDMIDDLLIITEKPRPNALERMLIRGQSDTTTIRNDLLDMKASNYLSYFQVEAALNTFLKIPESEWQVYDIYYPYIMRINDCVNCPLPDSILTLTKGELFEELDQLEFLAKAEPDNAARYYFKLGLAFYNMTYFSYDWDVMDYFRSGSSLPRFSYEGTLTDVIPHPNYPLNNRENFDCSRALRYFELCLDSTNDPELGAKAAFMAAKCERNAFYAYGTPRTYEYFNQLMTYYNDTDFYAEIIEECKYFAAYASK